MLKTLTKLNNANVDHYNNHPTRHTIISYGLMLGAGVALNAYGRWAANGDLRARGVTIR
jgi:hypothetical protein